MGMTSRVLAGALFAGGIIVSGIVFTGSGSITEIKGNIDSIQTDLVEAVSDNNFLKGAYTELEGLYTSTTEVANAKIDNLLVQRKELIDEKQLLEQELISFEDISEEEKAQYAANILSLTSEIDSSTSKIAQLETDIVTYKEKETASLAAKTELQNEITRLESEVSKANTEIESLKLYAQGKDTEINYTPVVQSEYEPEELASAYVNSIPYSQEVVDRIGLETVKKLSDYETIKAIQDTYTSKGFDVTIIELVLGQYDMVTYIIKGDTTRLKEFTPNNSILQSLTQNNLTGNLILMDEQLSIIDYFSPN